MPTWTPKLRKKPRLTTDELIAEKEQTVAWCRDRIKHFREIRIENTKNLNRRSLPPLEKTEVNRAILSAKKHIEAFEKMRDAALQAIKYHKLKVGEWDKPVTGKLAREFGSTGNPNEQHRHHVPDLPAGGPDTRLHENLAEAT